MLAIGTYKLTPQQAYDVVLSGLKLGYRIIDTAELYQNEKAVQKAIKEATENFNIPRDEIFLITKLRNCTEKDIQDRIDIFGQIECLLIHKPTKNYVKDWIFLAEHKPPQVKYIGVSNFNQVQLEQLLKTKTPPPYCNQIEISPFWIRSELISYHKKHHILTMAHSPLTKTKKIGDERLLLLAQKYKCSTTTLLLNWALSHSDIIVVGTSNVQHLEENQKIIFLVLSDRKEMNSWNEDFATHPQYLRL